MANSPPSPTWAQEFGLFTVLMWSSCQTIRRERPAQLDDHAAAEHPGWVARYELLRPYPNQRRPVVYRRVEDPAG